MGYPINKLEVVNELHMMNCGECGTPFAMEGQLYEKLREAKGRFYCPNGHCRVFAGKTEAQKLQERLDAMGISLSNEIDARRAAERRENKLRKRIARGVCPCCKRSFENLRRHMETKHPSEKLGKPIGI